MTERRTCISCIHYSVTKGTAAKPPFHGCDLAIDAITGVPAPAEIMRWSFTDLPAGYLVNDDILATDDEEDCAYEGKWWESRTATNGLDDAPPVRGKKTGKTPPITVGDDEIPW